MEKCQSGLSCFLAKEVGFTPPEVRILSSPRVPKTTRSGLFLFARAREERIRTTEPGDPLGRRVVSRGTCYFMSGTK